MIRSRLFLFLLLALLGITSVFMFSSGQKTAPEITINTIDGNHFNLAQPIPGPLLIHFWSTTCGICIKEMPAMNKLYSEMHDKGFNIIAIALSHSPPNTVLELTEKLNMPFPVAVDINNEISHAFGNVELTPTSILLSKNREIILTQTGGGHLAELEMTLDHIFQDNNNSG